MNSSHLIHKLFYFALIEIRYEGHSDKNNAVYHLADLFHNVPSMLEKAAHGEESYDKIFEEIKTHAKDRGYESWVSNIIDHIKKHDHPDLP